MRIFYSEARWAKGWATQTVLDRGDDLMLTYYASDDSKDHERERRMVGKIAKGERLGDRSNCLQKSLKFLNR